MAKRKRSKSTSSKKYKKSKPFTTAIVKAGRSRIVGIPAGQKVQMKYYEEINMKNLVVAYSEATYRAFSIYDPAVAVGGHQPLGHDQWAVFYKKYRVMGSKIEVRFSNHYAPTAGSENVPVTFGLCLTETTTSIADIGTLIEQPVSKWKTASFGESYTLSLPYNSNWQTKGDLGNKYDDDNAADFGSTPAADSYYHIIASRLGVSTLYATAHICITYDVWVFDPIQLTQS